MSGLKALGEKVGFTGQYDPTQLEGFSRTTRREGKVAPMNGADIWTAFEVSFLLKSGLPCFLVLRILNPSNSKNIFESKSLKLYLNSFNNTTLGSKSDLIKTIEKDLRLVAGGEVKVEEVKGFLNPSFYYKGSRNLENFVGNITIEEYVYNPKLLVSKPAKENRGELINLHSDLLRSNCEVTGAPDFARILITYEPGEVEVTYESLLAYIISIREHQMFHEPTVEEIYNTLYTFLNPKKLLVIGQYTRRGGIDINPCRYTHESLLQTSLLNLPKLLQQ